MWTHAVTCIFLTHTHWADQGLSTHSGGRPTGWGLDPKYQLLFADQWLTSQPATARLTITPQLKAWPTAPLQAARWIFYQSNDSPQKLSLCQLVSAALSGSLSMRRTPYFCLCLWRRGDCLGNERKQYLWRSTRGILPFSDITIISKAKKVLWTVWNQEWNCHCCPPKRQRYCSWSTKHKQSQHLTDSRKYSWNWNYPLNQSECLCSI